MKIFPDKEAFTALAERGNLIPVCADLMADMETPVSVYAKLRARGPAFLLESVTGGENVGRYSFAGARPRQIITVWADHATVEHRDGVVERFDRPPADPLSLVEKIIARCRPVTLPDMPPFTGGAIGFAGYEYIHCIEPAVPPAAHDGLGIPILHFLVLDNVVIFDHARQLVRLCVNAFVDEPASAGEAWEQAVMELRVLFNTLATPRASTPAEFARDAEPPAPSGNFTREAFEAAVRKTKEYVRAGDGVQVVLSQRFERPYHGTPLDLYRVLRYVNPSPYMFILESGEGFQVVGASPEVNVRLKGRAVEIRPIAGTRPRGASPAEDRRLEAELLADAKEQAEHLMLVDLARNDIGRVCETGSVRVSDYAAIERYSHVMHIVSQVEGTLAAGKNAFDLFRATFPAGTLSGAPKVRAMQIISELEGTRRGFYGGALGYFSFSGNHDSCITIRSALLKDGKAYIQAGAGVVADSDPASEYMETVNKSLSVAKAVSIAERMSTSR
ncbi:MAG: anthranilate synthase component I [Puniceicoccales bacterium]|jgi:anthranilate synthase component 1|nr:anthranilate synthase component I [Puniceicoccales bacterium]